MPSCKMSGCEIRKILEVICPDIGIKRIDIILCYSIKSQFYT